MRNFHRTVKWQLVEYHHSLRRYYGVGGVAPLFIAGAAAARRPAVPNGGGAPTKCRDWNVQP